MGDLSLLKMNLENDVKQSLDWRHFQDVIKSLQLAKSSLRMGCSRQAEKAIDQILGSIR